MSNIIQVWTWTLHFASADDEWEAACGETEPEMLVEPGGNQLPGYSICPRCDALTNGPDAIRSSP